MKLKRLLWTVLFAALLLSSACSQETDTLVPVETTIPEVVVADEPIILTLAGPQETQSFTMNDLQALPATSGQAGMKSSTGKITVPTIYEGVLLTDLLDRVGGLSPEYGVSVIAEDGYAMTISYDQIMNGNFLAYDPSDGSEKQIDEKLRVLVAYHMDGQPLDAQRDGILRLVIISERNNQVTDGHWSIKWVNRIEVQPLVQEWNLSLDGVADEVIDRNTFQSCGAVSCHQSSWTDSEGQEWSGVPLYLLAGRMDDETKHDGPAYNRDLANAGYLIQLIASDGYSTTVTSSAAYYNRDILVAFLVDGSPLPDKYFPLRLVGEGLESNQLVGSITDIQLVFDESMVVEPTPTIPPPPVAGEPPAGTTLWITRQTATSLALNNTSIASLQTVTLTAEHPKNGPTEYEGIYLNTLIGLASPLPGATTVVLTASDGYTVSLDLALVQACTDCLVAFTETEGVYNMVMPGFESSAWTKEIVKIEIQ